MMMMMIDTIPLSAISNPYKLGVGLAVRVADYITSRKVEMKMQSNQSAAFQTQRGKRTPQKGDRRMHGQTPQFLIYL